MFTKPTLSRARDVSHVKVFKTNTTAFGESTDTKRLFFRLLFSTIAILGIKQWLSL